MQLTSHMSAKFEKVTNCRSIDRWAKRAGDLTRLRPLGGACLPAAGIPREKQQSPRSDMLSITSIWARRKAVQSRGSYYQAGYACSQSATD